MDRIWQKGPGTGNENVGTEKRTGSEKGSVGPAQGIPGKKKGAGKVSGKVGTGNGQPESTFTLVYWGFIPSFPTKGQLENDFNLTEDFYFNFVSSFRQV